MIKITSMEKKGIKKLVSSSLKLIAGEIGKKRQFFRLLAVLKPYANNHKKFTQTSHRRGTDIITQMFILRSSVKYIEKKNNN
jgi:hypothetical protein